MRQRPATAKGILFFSLEDESGLLDVVIKPEIYVRFRDVLRHELLLVVQGLVQQAEGATNCLVHHVERLGDGR